MDNVGDILSELRKDKKLTQGDVSKITHLSISAISAYETGRRYPKLDVLTTLSKVYDVTTDYILGRSQVNLSPEILGEIFIADITYGDLIELLRLFSTTDKQFFLKLIDTISKSYFRA